MNTHMRNLFCTLAILFFAFPAFAYAALVNINTADKATLMTLTGLGGTGVKAQAVIDYRSQHGLFNAIEDIMKVSGIGQATFNGFKANITVGDTNTSNPPAEGDQAASSTPPVATSTAETSTSSTGGGPAEYLPIPTLRIITSGNRTVSSDADTAFTAVVYDGNANKRDDATVRWSFGDGMQKTGASVFHSYYYPGEYLAVVHATTNDGGAALSEIVITVKDASVKIVSVSSRGITLANNDSRTLDLSFWRLSAGGQEFKIPEDTEILAGRTILFPSQVIELPTADSASLLYPSGEVADTYSDMSASTQPFLLNTSSNIVQAAEPPVVKKIEPITSTQTNIQKNEETVKAPAAATELAAAGAALQDSSGTASTPSASASTLIKSPWTLGFLGVVLLTGGAFVLL